MRRRSAHLDLLENVAHALRGRGFEGEHGVVAVEGGEGGAVGVEGFVVEFDELLWASVSPVYMVELWWAPYSRCSRSQQA